LRLPIGSDDMFRATEPAGRTGHLGTGTAPPEGRRQSIAVELPARLPFLCSAGRSRPRDGSKSPQAVLRSTESGASIGIA
jgi:hypothetical protein